MHVATIATVDGTLEKAGVQELVENRLHLLPRFRQKLGFVPFNIAHPEWLDDQDFNLENHLTYKKLGNVSKGNALKKCLKAAQPLLDRALPLWRLHVYTARKKTYLVSVVHQALVGTGSPLDMCTTLFDLQSNPKSSPTAQPWAPSRTPASIELASNAIQENTVEFSNRARRLGAITDQGDLVQRATESLTRFITDPVYLPSWNRNLVSAERIFQSVRLDSAAIRRAKNLHGGTVNDLVTAIIVESAARYIESLGENADSRLLRIMQPVTVRREDADGIRGNRMSAIFPVFEATPRPILERLKEVRLEAETIKHNREAQALQLLTELAPPLPPMPTLGDANNLFNVAALNFTSFNPSAWLQQFSPLGTLFGGATGFTNTFTNTMAGFNFAVSTIPGAQTTQYCLGFPVTHLRAMPILAANLGLGINVLTYDQSVYFNLVADPSLVNDLEPLAAFIKQCFDEITTEAHAA